MKRFFTLLSVMVAFACMVSCTSSTPAGVVKEYAKSIMNEDYDAAISLFYFSSDDPAVVESSKNKMSKMFDRFVKPEFDKNGGVADFEIGETTISEDGLTATVVFDYIYGNGKVDDQKSKLKCVDGQWYLDSGK